MKLYRIAILGLAEAPKDFHEKHIKYDSIEVSVRTRFNIEMKRGSSAWVEPYFAVIAITPIELRSLS